MGWYRRSKLAFEAFHIIASKFKPKNPTHKPNPHNFALASPISRTSAFQFGPKQGQSSRFLLGTRRKYYVGLHHHAQHFRGRKWYRNPRTVVLVGSGVVITVYYGHLETGPYSKRKHLVMRSKNLEKQIGEAQFEQIKKAFKGKILHEEEAFGIHPESIRVRVIALDIIEALQRGLRKDKMWSDLKY